PIPNFFTWGCVALLTFLAIDGRVYQGDVAPYVRILESGGTTFAGTPAEQGEFIEPEQRNDIDAARRADPAWNR
ncbi:MAG: hypothetical protein JNG90_01485, partial [Planctomycetaceae bacterium]|nr:hypothetical protein [Planctomycetaceae bacterium]